MWRVLLGGIRTHRLRTALTGLAVTVGVALMVGTAVLVGSGQTSVQQASAAAYADVAIAVQGLPRSNGVPGPAGLAPLPAALAAEVARVPGVGRVAGQVEGDIQLVGSGGQLLDSASGLSTGVSVAPSPALRSVDLVAGTRPRAADQVVVDTNTASAQGWRIGRHIQAGGAGPVRSFRITGLVAAGGAGATGATLAGFSVPETQSLLGRDHQFTYVLATALAGHDPSTLAAAVQRVVGPGYRVLTGQELIAETSSYYGGHLPSLSPVLGVLVGVALFVGAIVVFNALSIVVAQRRRELALLRCLGATRGQIRRAVVAEAAVVGVAGSVLGVLLGIGAAAGLRDTLAGSGQGPPGALHVGRAVPVAAVLLGTVVTVLASLLPAVRASRTAPVAALRLDALEDVRSTSRVRGSVSLATFPVGLLLLALTVVDRSGPTLLWFSLGSILVLGALAVAGPLLVPAVAGCVGWPFTRLGGQSGFFGRRNTVHNARRTASTAAALVIGVALVSLLAVTSASARASADRQLDQEVRADFLVVHSGSGPLSAGPSRTVPLPAAVLGRLEAQRQLLVSPFDFVVFDFRGHGNWGAAVDTATFPSLVDLGRVRGRLAALDDGGIAASSGRVAAEHLAVGDTVTGAFPAGARGTVTLAEPVRATYTRGDNYSGYLFSLKALEREVPAPSSSAVFATPRPGVSRAAAEAALRRALHGFPAVEVMTQSQQRSSQNSAIDGQIDVLALLLVLAVLIAFFGIANTLVLSVFERTRELALLRALGMTPRQLRGMIQVEATIIGTIGALVGVLLGLLLGWALQRTLASQGLIAFDLPWAALLTIVVLGAATGFVAGVVPARRAGTVDMISALSEE